MKNATIDPFTELRRLSVQDQHTRCPSFPEAYLVPRKYTDKTANGLTACIIDFLRFNGWQAERINSTGRVIDRRQTYTNVLGHVRTIGSVQYIPTSGTRGTADISATVRGRSVKIEVKIGKDRQSEYQAAYQKAIEASGGVYYIAKDFRSFHAWYLIAFTA